MTLGSEREGRAEPRNKRGGLGLRNKAKAHHCGKRVPGAGVCRVDGRASRGAAPTEEDLAAAAEEGARRGSSRGGWCLLEVRQGT